MNYLVSSRSLLVVLSVCIFAAGTSAAKPDLSRLSFHPVPLADAAAAANTVAAEIITAPAELKPSPGNSDDGQNTLTITRYKDFISSTLVSAGPYALPISEAAFALGRLQEASGDLDAALASFERSMQILRINHGLFSTEQVPVMRAIINIHIERNDVESAHEVQEALYNLQTRHHGFDNITSVSSLLEWADWNVNMFLLKDQVTPQFINTDTDQLRSRLRDPRLSLAYTAYTQAIFLLQEKSTLADERLVTTERKLAALNFIFNRKVQDVVNNLPTYAGQARDFNSPSQILEQANTIHFADGSSALRRAIAYSYSAPNPDYDYIAARMMELGDWYLLFDRRSAALDIYGDALDVMLAAQLPQEEVERIMAPGMPVQTPDATYLAASENNDNFAGFIDVEFDLSKFGMATNPQIIGASMQDRSIEKELLRTIRNCKFRPKFVAGTPVSDEKIRLRYYYNL
jgi:tetratricopeptide (TPR) repeat protein